MSKADDLRKKAQVLLAQAKKLEEENVTKLGAETAKYFAGTITLEQLKAKAIEFDFDVVAQKPSSENVQQNNFGGQS